VLRLKTLSEKSIIDPFFCDLKQKPSEPGETIQKVFSLNACRLVKERNPGGGVQEGEVGMKEPITDNYSLGRCQFY